MTYTTQTKTQTFLVYSPFLEQCHIRFKFQVTISIGEDVREQNRLLNSMDDDFDSSKGLLMSTMKRLGIVSRAGGMITLFSFH